MEYAVVAVMGHGIDVGLWATKELARKLQDAHRNRRERTWIELHNPIRDLHYRFDLSQVTQICVQGDTPHEETQKQANAWTLAEM